MTASDKCTNQIKNVLLCRSHPHKTLAQKIADGHSDSPKSDKWQAAAMELVARDGDESSVPHGQRVSDVFPLADVVVDTSDGDQLEKLLKRFFFALFGNFVISPTKGEFSKTWPTRLR